MPWIVEYRSIVDGPWHPVEKRGSADPYVFTTQEELRECVDGCVETGYVEGDNLRVVPVED